MKQAAAQAGGLAQRTLERALVDMPTLAAQSADIVERESLREAARVLAKHEPALIEAFPQALLAAMAHALSGDTRRASGLSFDSLETMGDEQVRDSVEAVRAQQAVLRDAQDALRELDALVSAAQGFATVQPQRNPLRPETYVRALLQAVRQSPVSPVVRRRWTAQLAEAMGPELAQCYRELSQMLRSQGVGEATEPVAGGDERQQAMLTLQELRKLLAGPAPEAPLPEGAFPMTMPAALEKLQELRQVEPVIRRLRERGLAGASPRTAAQALAMEVVRLMVENIACDARLLAPVREAVRGLEPALMRLARDDTRFFSDRRHPARMLLDEMTQRSLAWASEDAPGFADFAGPLAEAVEALAEAQAATPEVFEVALSTLQEAWGEAKRPRARAVRALVQAEQRNLLAGRIAHELRQRPDVQAAPTEIAQFLAGPWAQVMAQARLADTSGATDPEGYAAIVPDLVWSTQAAPAGASPARLARTAAPLQDRIAKGLASIGYPQALATRLLGHVAALQRQAADRGEAPLASRRELEAQFDRDTVAGSWLAPLEARDSTFMTTHPSLVAPQPPDGVEPALPDEALQAGAWLDMAEEGGWARWQLTWASPHGTLFLFTHPTGRQQSMTRRLLHNMLQQGTLRMVTGRALVDGALDAVADAALRNTAGVG
ncbi:MAG: DUF1631 family protein [Burkholderiales bacterium]|nr:DUF1631 family protein [Burkholderiales bacterium]